MSLSLVGLLTPLDTSHTYQWSHKIDRLDATVAEVYERGAREFVRAVDEIWKENEQRWKVPEVGSSIDDIQTGVSR